MRNALRGAASSICQPLRVGHRGAGAHAPHNTRLSFELALSMGVDMLETDVRICGSGDLVLAHDPHLHLPLGQGPTVASSSLSELQAVDLGQNERLLQLNELLQLAHGRCSLMLDLKGEEFEAKMVQELRRSAFPPQSIVIPGGSAISRARLRQMAPEYAVGLSLERLPDCPPEEFISRIDASAVSWHYSLLHPQLVDALHQRGLTVYAWTVDRADDMRRMIDSGVDGVITNRPDLLNEVIGGRSTKE